MRRLLVLPMSLFLLWLSAARAVEDRAADKVEKVRIEDFSKHLPTFQRFVDAESIDEKQLSSSPNGTSSFVINPLTGLETNYEDTKAVIKLFTGGKAAGCLRVESYKNLSADWVTEEVLRVSVWPGRLVEIVALFDVTTGKTIHSSAWMYLTNFRQQAEQSRSRSEGGR